MEEKGKKLSGITEVSSESLILKDEFQTAEGVAYWGIFAKVREMKFLRDCLVKCR